MQGLRSAGTVSRECCVGTETSEEDSQNNREEEMKVFKGGLNTRSVCGRERGHGEKQ